MEFEELQQIWDLQNNQPMYAINEKALHNRILSKKKQTYHITNVSELLLIMVNIGAGCIILGMNFYGQPGSIFMYLLSAWMFGTALYVLVSRIRRIQGDRRFDRSVRGDLHHAISVATYQLSLSQIMRWNILPIGSLVLLGIWGGGKSVWVAVLTVIAFSLAYHAGAWEHSIYKARKRELEILQNKLENEKPSGDHSS